MVHILFLHPDLGIGGAERLVVDAALALQSSGHSVSFLTNHHDKTHCFKETSDGTIRVEVVGDWLPRSLFGRFYAFCAYFRMIYAAFYASFCLTRREKVDVIFCDQISIGIPVLLLATRPRPKIIFYCHFPDQLLSRPEGLLKRIYRAPLNYLEEVTVDMADTILVNSKFTLRVFRDTFRRIETVPVVLYPSLNTKYFDDMQLTSSQNKAHSLLGELPRNAFIFLDINRYERKKNHALALNAFRVLGTTLTVDDWKRCRLIIAGGYDTRVLENIQHYKELQNLSTQCQVQDNVVMLRSPSDDEKFELLRAAHCLVYTPSNEHFGIVPLEGMYMSKPVIAVNSGGPMETIVDNLTGILCEPQQNAFAKAMAQLFNEDALRERMGDMGRKRVQQRFSFGAFATKLDSIVAEVLAAQIETAKKHN